MNMEFCFLSSNSLFPPHSFNCRKPKYLSHQKTKKRNSTEYPNGYCYKGIIVPPLRCCIDGASTSPLDDDYKPLIENADWRSFRSMLMAAETASKPPQHSSNWSDFVTKTNHHTRVKKTKNWAHILHKPETGCLLVATEKLDGVHIFKGTAILLLSMDHQMGSTGVILNRPLDETTSTVSDDLDTVLDKPSFYGGPFNETLFLVGPIEVGGDDDDGWMRMRMRMRMSEGFNFKEVMDGFYYGTNKENVKEMVERGGVGIKDLRVMDGCCRWEKNKLEEEIRDGYWKVIACSPSMIGLA